MTIEAGNFETMIRLDEQPLDQRKGKPGEVEYRTPSGDTVHISFTGDAQNGELLEHIVSPSGSRISEDVTYWRFGPGSMTRIGSRLFSDGRTASNLDMVESADHSVYRGTQGINYFSA